MKDREIVCIHYKCEHNCDLGKDAEFRGKCQHCPFYIAKKGAAPARVNNKKKKIAILRKRDEQE